MNYKVYKMEFTTPVHFGIGMLNDSDIIFRADSLYSALYQEAMKLGVEDVLFINSKNGDLRFSDALPYIGDEYYIPKPMLYVENDNKGDSILKKRIKNTKYISLDDVENFLGGVYDKDIPEFGESYLYTKAFVRRLEDTEPYHVGTYRFKEKAGLYIIVAYNDICDISKIELLLEFLSYTGIGGKKSSGLGKYVLKYGNHIDKLIGLLECDSDMYISLTTSLPKDDELNKALEDASYSLVKRSGYIDTLKSNDINIKKNDFYMFSSGSCFTKKFEGDIFDVAPIRASHPVYRYAKPIFMGVVK